MKGFNRVATVLSIALIATIMVVRDFSPLFAVATAAGQAEGTYATATATQSATYGAGAAAYNLRITSDASPDLTDLQSLIHSTTSQWASARDKVWSLFYWTHMLKRQTPPTVLHGLEVCNHTVSTVAYDGKFRVIDSSMSSLVTTDDGVTLASLQEAAADFARLVRQRSANSTSPNGFLSGTDALRHLADAINPADGTVVKGFAANYCANSLKHRDYFYNWDAGHRYVLNLREHESYTRYYRRLGSTPDYWVGSERISAPNPDDEFEIDSPGRFGNRGNGHMVIHALARGDGLESRGTCRHEHPQSRRRRPAASCGGFAGGSRVQGAGRQRNRLSENHRDVHRARSRGHGRRVHQPQPRPDVDGCRVGRTAKWSRPADGQSA
jgi:hypothetical protein